MIVWNGLSNSLDGNIILRVHGNGSKIQSREDGISAVLMERDINCSPLYVAAPRHNPRYASTSCEPHAILFYHQRAISHIKPALDDFVRCCQQISAVDQEQEIHDQSGFEL